MNGTRRAVITVILSGLVACASIDEPDRASVRPGAETALARYLQIEVDDPGLGIPCRVVDRPGAGVRQELLRAETSAAACFGRVRQARAALEADGWACRPLSVQEQRDDPRLAFFFDPGADTAALQAVWRCFDGLAPLQVRADTITPLPPAKPVDAVPAGDRAADAGSADTLLLAAVERDLEAIGQRAIDDETIIRTAFGDLDGDAVDDAVVFTGGTDEGRPYRMLMAYLRTDDSYTLVDVAILQSTGEAGSEDVTLSIDDGTIRVDGCCRIRDLPAILVLRDRELSPIDGGGA